MQTKAFQLVTAELEARSNKAARQQIEVGASQPIKFSFVEEDSGEITSTIDVPEDSFVNILRYLDGHELAKASCVSKVWLSVTRLPIVWEDGVDMSRLNYNKALNMTSLLKLLQRPQFANVKAFAFPKKVKIGDNTMKQLAKALPHLEALDLSDSKAKDQHVMAAIENFPSLNALRIDTWFSLTSSGITSAVQMMGEQLLDLRIETILSYVSESTMIAIATHCPNLKYFAFRDRGHYSNNLDGVTGRSVVALVRACGHLETLELHKTTCMKQCHYVEIAELVSSNLEMYALRNIIATGTIDVCEVLAEYTFLNVQDKCESRWLGIGVMFWSKYEKRDREEETKKRREEEMTNPFQGFAFDRDYEALIG